ncbi:unnamed protein product [Urochloa humidicola]
MKLLLLNVSWMMIHVINPPRIFLTRFVIAGSGHLLPISPCPIKLANRDMLINAKKLQHYTTRRSVAAHHLVFGPMSAMTGFSKATTKHNLLCVPINYM